MKPATTYEDVCAYMARMYYGDSGQEIPPGPNKKVRMVGLLSLDLTFHSLKLRSYPTSIISITVQGSTLTFFVLDMMDIRVEMRRKATGRLIKSPN